jgi:hypothetical protein
MTFLFAYLGSLSQSSGWPIHLMHLTEAGFVILTLGCIVAAICLPANAASWLKDLISALGGISASFGLIMPFELAPFFFGARGEVMLASILLNLAYPFAALGFIFVFRKSMGGAR